MKRRIGMALLIAVSAAMTFAGCGSKEKKQLPNLEISVEEIADVDGEKESKVSETAQKSETLTEGEESNRTNTDSDTKPEEDVNKDATKPENEKSIQKEIAEVEAKSLEYENRDWDVPQQTMNLLTGEWYALWDEELNLLWNRLTNEVDTGRKETLLEEQRAWIERKEANVKEVGEETMGGSIQPTMENTVAEEMTRARVYVLAGELAKVRGEEFVVSTEIQEQNNQADPSLEKVFEKYEGQHIFDLDRGSCVGVERTENCDYGLEGSKWTVWISGGDLFSDLDVMNYTSKSITFRVLYQQQL